MAFDLTIEMVGLCLFVPDRTEPPGTLYVLMASTGTEHGVDPHVARLCFDAAYVRPGSPGPLGYPVLVPVEETEIVFDTREALDLELPEELVNVAPVVRRPLLPGSLTGTNPPEQLAARVVLRSGRLGGYEPGACWNYPTDVTRRHMANRVRWDLGVMEGDELTIALNTLAGEEAGRIGPLYPIGGRIDLQLYYTPREELPPDPVDIGPPPVGSPAHHFAGYYELFEQPVAADPLPLFVGLSCIPTVMGGSPYTCMGAQNPIP